MSGPTTASPSPKTNGTNDIDLERWKEYGHIWTDSLWLIDERDESGAQRGGNQYHGNFVPQIPRQLVERYTHTRDWVFDPFCGTGTTLIEAKRLGRNSVGVEIQPEVAQQAFNRLTNAPGPSGTNHWVLEGDNRELLIENAMPAEGIQLAILHPPYHDIIRFSDLPGDLSTIEDYDQFRRAFAGTMAVVDLHLKPKGYVALVCGDKYAKGEWMPLAHDLMYDIRGLGYQLKSTIVKDFNETAGKAGQRALWRYRALRGGYYLFRHEYIFVLQKRG